MNEHLSKTRFELHDMFERFGLKQQIHAVIIKQAKKMCLEQGMIGEAFVFHKYNTLVGIIDEKKTQAGRDLTDAELKAIIVDWLKTEKQTAKKMYKGQNSDFSGYVKPSGEVIIETNKL
jgi:hypothetical protein